MIARTNQFRATAGVAFAVMLFLVMLAPLEKVSAHPLDRLRQHLLIEVNPEQIEFTLAVGGGVLATDLVAADLDSDGNGSVSSIEAAEWSTRTLSLIRVQLDGQPVAVDQSSVSAHVPSLELFRAGTEPVMVEFSADLPQMADSQAASLSIRNDYRVDRTDFLFDAQALPGMTIVDASWPGSTIRMMIERDPASPGTTISDNERRASAWSASGVVERAKSLLDRDRSPQLVLIMLAVFLGMGALHALQPGHGKAVAAAYLVASGGGPKDAFALAGVVTLTHTASVFAIGGATLLASQYFLPSTVVPIMEISSGLTVAGLGLTMLWRSLRGRLSPSINEMDADFAHHLHHHHDHLTGEEHARLHAEQALIARGHVSGKGLVALGISGGLVPCPDALAILLVAIGIHQAVFGMMAIVVFSLGLAATLVAFGLAVVLAGPFWTGVRERIARRGRAGSLAGALAGKAFAFAPVASAVIVLLLGAAMVWRAGSGL